MKRSADLLINGEYKRINIWDVIHWKTFEPEYWERNKDNFYSTYNANFKEKMECSAKVILDINQIN